jgi:2'-5' RNA ligase
MGWARSVNGQPYFKTADAEEAKQSGGMIALFPRTDFAQMLAVPGGEPEDDLHLTLVFLGDDVSTLDPANLGAIVGRVADSYTEITARIFGHAVLNPDGAEGRDPCGVYLVGHSPELSQLHDDVREAAEMGAQIPEQHDPWLPHITAGYASQMGESTQVREYTGEVIFDRLGLAVAGETQFYPFHGASIAAAYTSLAHWPL